jgi:spermidine synthase
VTVHAATTVLAAFMGGLAIGSFAAGRLADRVAAPLRWFGLAELTIAGTALLTPWLLQALDAVYRQVYAGVSDNAAVLVTVRFVASLAVLIVPTTLMGATAPLAIRSVTDGGAALGPRAAALYAANTAGALAGAFVTGYYLVSGVGITASFRLAAAINVVVGLAALLLPAARAHAAGRERAAATAGRSEDRPLHLAEAPRVGAALRGAPVIPRRARSLVLGMVAVSGFVGIALEIVWLRALVMFLPATTYVFTGILACVLGGIAFGSAVATRTLARPGDWLARLAALQAAAGVTAVASLARRRRGPTATAGAPGPRSRRAR